MMRRDIFLYVGCGKGNFLVASMQGEYYSVRSHFEEGCFIHVKPRSMKKRGEKAEIPERESI